MSLDPISAALDLGGKIIERLWKDPAQQDAARLELFKLQQAGELQAISGQLEINKVEAANPSLLVSGWRPATGWVCVAGLAYDFIARPLLTWGSGLAGSPVVPPPLDMGTLLTLLGGMLGLSGLRTYEKTQGVAAK